MRNGETRIGLYSIYSSHDVELECARKEMIDGTDLLFIAWEHLTSYSYNISNIAMITYYFLTCRAGSKSYLGFFDRGESV